MIIIMIILNMIIIIIMWRIYIIDYIYSKEHILVFVIKIAYTQWLFNIYMWFVIIILQI